MSRLNSSTPIIHHLTLRALPSPCLYHFDGQTYTFQPSNLSWLPSYSHTSLLFLSLIITLDFHFSNNNTSHNDHRKYILHPLGSTLLEPKTLDDI